MLLQLMVRPAFAIDVARASQPALVVRDEMVEIALFGGPTAWRIPAGLVPGGDQLGNPGRRPIGGRGQLMSAPAGPLVILPALLGGRGLPPCRRQGPVHDLRQRRTRRWRRVARLGGVGWRGAGRRRGGAGRRGTMTLFIRRAVTQLINPDN